MTNLDPQTTADFWMRTSPLPTPAISIHLPAQTVAKRGRAAGATPAVLRLPGTRALVTMIT
jgi:hypothetical protein